ncbi:MAG: S1C family serine protease [Mariniblastus sp.]|nr:S1C family serine protease [Mariniblastus sp.]
MMRCNPYPKRLSRVGIAALLGIGLTVVLDGSGNLGQAQIENHVSQIFAEANQRMVKVYGASAGRVEGYATGFLVSADGLVMTTQGVFLDGNRVRILTADGVEHAASVIRRDRERQLALLKIEVEDANYFSLAEGDVGDKGDWVVAISNAFKVADKDEPLSATLGVISLRTTIEARLNRRDVAYKGDLVLIDPITSNPGAAGGVIVNLQGQLVGMIGKIINSSDTNTRLNYAVPTSSLEQFVANEKPDSQPVLAVSPPVELGIRLFTHGGRSSPAYIDRVSRGSPARQAGMKPDDLIISIGGTKIGNVKDYEQVVAGLKVGEEVIIVVKRGIELIRQPIIPVEKK